MNICNIRYAHRPTESKESSNPASSPKQEEKKKEVEKSDPKSDRDASGAVDFDLALDYEEMDAPHSETDDPKEEVIAKNSQHSQAKTKDNGNADSSDESSGQGNDLQYGF